RSAAGGSAAAGGIGHEARCAAWITAHMLLEQRLPDWANRHTVMAVGGQTGRPVDDVAAVVSDGSRIGWMCVQAKTGLTLSQSDSSPLASSIEPRAPRG